MKITIPILDGLPHRWSEPFSLHRIIWAASRENQSPGVWTSSVINRHVQIQKKARDRKFWIFFSFSFTSLSRLFQLIWDGPISRWAKTGEPREKTPDTPTSKTWLVSHVAKAGLEPTPDTAVRWSSDKETMLLTSRPRGPPILDLESISRPRGPPILDLESIRIVLYFDCEADQCLCFRYMDSTIPLLLKSEISTVYHLLKLHRPVCVRPGRKPQRLVFSRRGSNVAAFQRLKDEAKW